MTQLSLLPSESFSKPLQRPRLATSAGNVSHLPMRPSRDEMNLAEFPLTVLSTRPNSGVKTLEFKDTIRGKNGDLVTRQWIITGADKFGLPTSSDDEVLLGLLKLTVDDGFRERKVYFTRYDLLRSLRWTTEGRSYARLQKALDRLSGVRIKATNAFYDNESKAHSTRNFGLIDAYEINDGRSVSPKPSFFVWSEVLFRSFQAGFIKKFDLDFYLGLKSAVSRRLYRYLDKHFWYKSKIQTNIFVLAHEKVGVSRNYKYASSLRQQLDPAFEELREHGILAEYAYQGKGQATEVTLIAGTGRAAKPGLLDPDSVQNFSAPGVNSSSTAAETEGSSAPRSGAGRKISTPQTFRHADLDSSMEEDCQAKQGVAELQSALIARGIREQQVKRLLEGKDALQLDRIKRILGYFDQLREAKSHLVSRSPVGFLYRAVENPERFVLPEEREGSSQKASQKTLRSAESSGKEGKAAPSLETSYLIARRREILKLRDDVEPALIEKLRAEVEKALVRIQGLISAERFRETVQHGVDERLAELFGLPSFEEWKGRKT
jgi:hypothetical protein